MELRDDALMRNRDWDPSYLSMLFSKDFNDSSDLWQSSVGDSELISHVEHVEKYVPNVEDISIEDNVLCEAVERIEEE